jgi:glycosyl hydrolase family 42 (putative beta-galactosidase)
MLSRETAAALREYVNQGGTLVSEARPAWNDDRGFANSVIPGAGLDQVFGVRESELRSPEQITMSRTHDFPELFPEQTIQGQTFEEHLKPLRGDVKILATFANGDPAITEAPFGKGHAILIGSFPAAAYEQDQSKASGAGRLLRSLAEPTGLEPQIQVLAASAAVEARFLDSGSSLILIAINHDAVAHEAILRLPAELGGRWQPLDGAARTDGSHISWSAHARDVLVMVRR